MAKTNFIDPKTGEAISPHISGLQEAVNNLEQSINMDTKIGKDIPLHEVFISNDDRGRIFQAEQGYRNWTSDTKAVVKANGVIISSGFDIEYGGGAIVFSSNQDPDINFTADVEYVIPTKMGSGIEVVEELPPVEERPDNTFYFVVTDTIDCGTGDCDNLKVSPYMGVRKV